MSHCQSILLEETSGFMNIYIVWRSQTADPRHGARVWRRHGCDHRTVDMSWRRRDGISQRHRRATAERDEAVSLNHGGTTSHATRRSIEGLLYTWMDRAVASLTGPSLPRWRDRRSHLLISPGDQSNVKRCTVESLAQTSRYTWHRGEWIGLSSCCQLLHMLLFLLLRLKLRHYPSATISAAAACSCVLTWVILTLEIQNTKGVNLTLLVFFQFSPESGEYLRKKWF